MNNIKDKNIKHGKNYGKGKRTYWDSVFRAAFFIMFSRFGDKLSLTDEYIMNDYPNRIDQIIKKNTKDVIDDVIAEFFLGYNIMEFKSPNDHLGIGACCRAIAYALLLISYGYRSGNTKERVHPDDVTLTVITERRPEKAFKYLMKHSSGASAPHAGVYRFQSFGGIPIQLIVYGEMDDKRCMMLRSLTLGNLPNGAADVIIDELEYTENIGNEDYKRRGDVILRFLYRNHAWLFKEGEAMFEFAEMIVADKTRRLVAEGRAEGIAEGRVEGIAEGRVEGRIEGRIEGALEMLFNIVKDGVLSAKDAAARANVGLSDFLARMEAWNAGKIHNV